MNIVIFSKHTGLVKYLDSIIGQHNLETIRVKKLEKIKEKIDIKTCIAVLIEINHPTEQELNICRELYRSGSVPVFLFGLSKKYSKRFIQHQIASYYLMEPLLNFCKSMKMKELNENEIYLNTNTMIDLETLCVWKGDECLLLTNQEYKILLFLFKNQERYIGSNEFISYLNLSGTDSLYVYIRRLREKIEEDPKDPKIIEMKRGKGYKLNLNKNSGLI